jgi:hypothetical protein
MIFEVTFWIAFILASQAIAKIYYRRRDVPIAPFMQRSSRKHPDRTKKRRTVNRALVESQD